jgi:hypothetical protein
VSVYVGNGLKFDQKLKPFPLQPPVFGEDVEEYEEVVIDFGPVNEIEKIIIDCTEQIWAQYDTDNSGSLEMEECQKFFADMLGQLDQKIDGDQLKDKETLQAAFDAIDKDGNGRIVKLEMMAFTKSLLKGSNDEEPKDD